MSFTDAVRSGFRNWNKLGGRASRSEFWFWYLFLIAVSFGYLFLYGALLSRLGVIASLLAVIVIVIGFVSIVPSFTMTVRRLHDTNRSGWWLLIALIPFGSLVILVFYCLDGTQGSNKYGDRPSTARPTP